MKTEINIDVLQKLLKGQTSGKLILEALNIFKMSTLKFDDDTEIIILTIDNTFMQFIQVENLLKPIHDLKANTLNINIDNLDYVLNNQSIKKDIPTCEKIYASIKSKYPTLRNINLNDIYLARLQNYNIVLIPRDKDFVILEVVLKQDKITTRKLKLSEPYKIFNPHNFSNIPVIYKKKARIDNIKENKGLNDTLKVKEIK